MNNLIIDSFASHRQNYIMRSLTTTRSKFKGGTVPPPVLDGPRKLQYSHGKCKTGVALTSSRHAKTPAVVTETPTRHWYNISFRSSTIRGPSSTTNSLNNGPAPLQLHQCHTKVFTHDYMSWYQVPHQIQLVLQEPRMSDPPFPPRRESESLYAPPPLATTAVKSRLER